MFNENVKLNLEALFTSFERYMRNKSAFKIIKSYTKNNKLTFEYIVEFKEAVYRVYIYKDTNKIEVKKSFYHKRLGYIVRNNRVSFRKNNTLLNALHGIFANLSKKTLASN